MLAGEEIAATFIRGPAACRACGATHAALEPCRSPIPLRSGHTQAVGPDRACPPEANPPDPLIGATVGNFRIVRELGRGGMGVVYLAEHVVIGSKVAIKFLHPYLAEDAALVERFFAEAKAANRVGHENIVSIVDLNLLPPNRYYLVMEYLEGRPLSALPMPVEPEEAIAILVQICDALEAAHAREVVHRDLKPDNVFLLKRGGSEHFVKLVDFGIAKLGDRGSQTLVGMTVGTPEFMAPEQWTGEPVDGRADLYAVGVIAYGLLTGRLPFSEPTPFAYGKAHREKPVEPPRQHNPRLPEELEAVVLKALAKSPEDRFRTAGEMRASLQAARVATPQKLVPAPGATALGPAASARTARGAQADAEAKKPGAGPASPARASTPTVPVRVRWSGHPAERPLLAGEVSRGGMLLFVDPPHPPLFSRVEVALGAAGGAVVSSPAEVVRHVDPAQARAWGVQPGYAVQLLSPSAAFQRVLERLMAGEAPPAAAAASPRGVDRAAEALLEAYAGRLQGDHYALFGLESKADQGEVRRRTAAAQRELEQLAGLPLSPAQRTKLAAVLARVRDVAYTLSDPSRRAAYDARSGNYLGVARCLAAGLRVSELERLRQNYLRERPKNETVALLHATSATAYLSGGDTPSALQALERALQADPLGLQLHQRYWALRRQLGSRRTPARPSKGP